MYIFTSCEQKAEPNKISK